MLVAMGIKNWAWKLLSSKMGIKPAIVVSDVRMTARNRAFPASSTAWKMGLACRLKGDLAGAGRADFPGLAGVDFRREWPG